MYLSLSLSFPSLFPIGWRYFFCSNQSSITAWPFTWSVSFISMYLSLSLFSFYVSITFSYFLYLRPWGERKFQNGKKFLSVELAKKISRKKKIRDAFSSLRGRVHIAFLINFDKFSFLFSSDMGIKGARHRFFAASLLRGIASSHRHRFSTSLLDIASRHRFSTRFSTRWSTPLLDSPSRFASRRRFSIPWSIRWSIPWSIRFSTSLLDSLVDSLINSLVDSLVDSLLDVASRFPGRFAPRRRFPTSLPDSLIDFAARLRFFFPTR